MRKISDTTLGIIFLIPSLFFVFLIIVYPVAANLFLSFFDYRIARREIPFIGLENYFIIFSDYRFWWSLIKTLIWTGGSLAFQAAVGISLGLLLNRKFKGRAFVRSILVIPWVLPPVVTCIVFKTIILEPRWGYLNYFLSFFGVPPLQWLASESLALPAVISVNIWYGFPLWMIITLAGLQSIPPHLYDAAKVDGSNYWQEFRYVTLPGLKYFLGTILVLRFIWIFQFFDIPWLMTKGGPRGATEILPVLTYITSFGTLKVGQGAAIAVAMSIFLFFWVILYIRVISRER
jgi:multiple sugar transport system permease protein